jgi:hypothetical protein
MNGQPPSCLIPLSSLRARSDRDPPDPPRQLLHSSCELAAKSASLFALDPNVRLAGLVAGLDVNDARAAADGAVFGVGLAFTAA